MKSTFKNLLLGTLLLCSITSLISCTKEVTSIRLNETELSLFEGDMFLLKATVEPEDASNKDVVWTSGNEHVASVREQIGLVTAISEGETIITASCGAVKASCRVIVSQKKVTSISLDQESALVFVGENFQLTATPIPEDAVDNAVVWSSSNTDIASVNKGMVSPLSAGTATITATAGECSASCIVNVLAPYGGMCLESIDGGTITISNPNMLPLEYKVEKQDWVLDNGQSISIVVYGKKRIWFRGNNMSYTTGNEDVGWRETTFNCRGDFYLYGNLMSLLYGDEYESNTTIKGDFAFFKLFYENKNIHNHPTSDIVLPATNLSPSCYRCMFYGCTEITRAPNLSATVLKENCYSSMFRGCTSLKEPPVISAEEMADYSCWSMFQGCGLERAPEISATKVADNSCFYMFGQCRNLKKGPSILPASQLGRRSYYQMFHDCEQLVDVPELPATELGLNCYEEMFRGCKSLSKAPSLPATELNNGCYRYMFSGCEQLKEAPELKAVEMKDYCYYGMFYGCSSLENAPTLPATTLAPHCYQEMFENSGLTEAPELPATKMVDNCYHSMFKDCKSLEKAPILRATIIKDDCYNEMFRGCSILNYVNAAFLSKPYLHTTDNWLEGVATEGTFVKNPDAAWDVWGPTGIPEGWAVVYE